MVEGLTYIEFRARLRPPRAGAYQRSVSLFDRRAASRGGAVAARRAHNPKVGGSNPSPATKSGRLDVRCWRLDGSVRSASPASNIRPLTSEYLWWSERGGPTRSHPEHGSETPQRRRYWGSNPLRKIGHCQGILKAPRESAGLSPCVVKRAAAAAGAANCLGAVTR